MSCGAAAGSAESGRGRAAGAGWSAGAPTAADVASRLPQHGTRVTLALPPCSLAGGQAEQRRESSLKYQTRCVRCHADGRGYALSSVEGRVAWEFFELDEATQVWAACCGSWAACVPLPAAADLLRRCQLPPTRLPLRQAGKYAFKCHRRAEGGRDLVFPVNAIAFNTPHGTFATGGGDGVVNFWDGAHKKRLAQVAGYPTSVAALAFSGDAARLAVASSYTFEQVRRRAGGRALVLGVSRAPGTWSVLDGW